MRLDAADHENPPRRLNGGSIPDDNPSWTGSTTSAPPSTSRHPQHVSEDRMSFDLQGPLAGGLNDNTEDDPVGELGDAIFAEGIPVATDIRSGPDGTICITSNALNALPQHSKPPGLRSSRGAEDRVLCSLVRTHPERGRTED